MNGIKRVLGGALFTAPPMLPVQDLAAAGNSQGTGGLIVRAAVNVTAADGTKGVVLPAIVRSGMVIAVYNSVATNGLKIYPASGAAINGGTGDAAITIEGKTLAVFLATSATNWAAMYTAET